MIEAAWHFSQERAVNVNILVAFVMSLVYTNEDNTEKLAKLLQHHQKRLGLWLLLHSTLHVFWDG